jgi:peptidoglycan/LPS O-acetylase OafA/YrhL
VVLYCAYAALWRYRDRPDRMLFFGALLSAGLAEAYFHAGQSAAFGQFALRMPGFFLGLVAGRLLKAGRVEIPLSAYLGCAFLLYFYFPYTEGIIFVSSLVGMALIVGYALLLRPLVPAAGRSALIFLGEHSLEIFLIHQPLIREYNVFVLQRIIPSLHGGGVPGPVALTIGMCVALWLTLEISAKLHRLFARFSGAGRGNLVPAAG